MTQRVYKRRQLVVPGVGGRLVGQLLRSQERTGRFSRMLKIVDRLADGHISTLKPIGTVEMEIYTPLTTAYYWHGTGRYQYSDGRRIDMLTAIAGDGYLRPKYDALDFKGPKYVISTARSRMYARAYADIHGKGANEKNRHGSSMFWAVVFGGDFFVEQFKEILKEPKIWTRAKRKEIRKRYTDAGGAAWYKKVRVAPTSILKVFCVGSDIEENYPILFGIRDGAFVPSQKGRALSATEARSDKPLSLKDDITHVEVPEIYITEVETLFREHGHTVTVLSIEECERYCAGLPLSRLVLGNTRTRDQ